MRPHKRRKADEAVDAEDRRPTADDNPRRAGNQRSPETAGTSREDQGPQKRKRGRPSLAELAVSKAQNQAGPPPTDQQEKKRGRGRPPRTSNETNSPEQNPPPSSAKPSKKKNPPNRRRSSSTEPTAAAPATNTAAREALAKYRHLTTRTRQIPRATIKAKWTPLDTPSITAVSALIADASRPVLHRLRDRDQRHAQAQSILRTFAASLHAKLVKGMPFPPPSVPAAASSRGGGGGGGGHGAELDLERTVDAIGGLERVLDPLVHSLVLLRGEKEREERALEREYAVLRRLEGN
ncbi:hypothetical protein C8A00DRAFT_15975, partial [Chaetomidium leptoderma]